MEKNFIPDLSGDAVYNWTDADLNNTLAQEERTRTKEESKSSNDQDFFTKEEQRITGGENKPYQPTEIDEFTKTLQSLDNPLANQRANPNYLDDSFNPETGDLNEGTDEVKETGSVETPTTEDENPSNVYSAAFEILKEFGLIDNSPEFEIKDEDSIARLREITLQKQQDDLINYMRYQVNDDPQMTELVDYALQGGRFADLTRMKEMIQDEYDYASFDINDVDNQKDIVRDYLLATGTPEKHVDTVIKSLNEDMKLETEAQDAKTFFVQQVNIAKDHERQRIAQMQMQEEEMKRHQQAQVEAWNNAFVDSVQKRQWDKNKKDEIFGSYSPVQLQNGEQMPMYQYKEQVIRSNPELFAEYLDWLTGFDPQKGSFNHSRVNRASETAGARKIISNLMKKQSGSSKGAASRPNSSSKRPVANPNDQLNFL